MQNGNGNPVLESREVTKTFRVRDQDIEVLKGVNLQVQPGEIVVIRGRSGAGKSVLLWILSGLDKPASGEVLVAGQPFTRLSSSKLAAIRRDKIGIIFQNFNLITSWTAGENVEAVLKTMGMGQEASSTKAKLMLTGLGLAERLNHFPGELSIGQQQRVAIARTLCREPTIIFADEPTGDVDSDTAKEIIDLLIKPVKENGAALIVATHGDFPLEFADRSFVLRDGVLIRE